MGFSKECTKCGRVKWWYEFDRGKKGCKFSIESQCSNCSKAYQKKSREKNKDKRRRRYVENRDEIFARMKCYLQKEMDELSDNYVKKLICRQFRIKRKDITQNLVILKRQQLKIYRALREANK